MASGPTDRTGHDATPESPDLWPALLWIAAGIWQFAAFPMLFAWWKGVLYFLVGAPVMLLVTGTATARLRGVMLDMVRDVFPVKDRFTWLIAVLLRVMLAALEGVLVLTAARGAFMLMA
ncbi:MAG TPA: hypothetical protein VD995_19925 [Azospirillum sp.]|nr:hypothetical protein [Azospirillum sp.]